MLNMFKSPKKTQDINNEDSLLVKQFNGLNIQVYGTYENPLFKAKDIGELLGIDKIKSFLTEWLFCLSKTKPSKIIATDFK